MNNIVLQMLSEFILENYDSLKKDYNALSEADKSKLPSALFFIKIFDTVLGEQQRKNLTNAINEPKIITSDTSIITPPTIIQP